MIKLRFSFGKEHESDRQYDIADGEMLSAAVSRLIDGIPLSGKAPSEVFQVIVNGNLVESAFWEITALKTQDRVLVSPRLRDGESGQLLRSGLMLAITVVAAYYLGPAGLELEGIGLGLAVGAVTIGASLLLNGLIPPPTIGGLDLSRGDRDLSSSQMYAITGQSNQVKQFQPVPKVYGRHRIFPNVAANPYTSLEVDPRTNKQVEYLYVVYDFGLGPMTVNNLMIGDTPLTEDNFSDFKYNLVDFNKPTSIIPPAVAAQIPGYTYVADSLDSYWNSPLKTVLEHYTGDSSGDSFSLSLSGNKSVGDNPALWQAIRNTATNELNSPQKIILTFVNPQGLYSSNGVSIGTRQIDLTITFRNVNDSAYDYKAYNDKRYVDNSITFGGLDATDLSLQLAAVGDPSTIGGTNVSPENNPFYDMNIYQTGERLYYYGGHYYNTFGDQYIKPGQNKLFMLAQQPNPANPTIAGGTNRLLIGREVYFRGSDFLGNVLTVEPWSENSDYTVVTLDRNIAQRPFGLLVAKLGGLQTYAPLSQRYLYPLGYYYVWTPLPGDRGYINSTTQGYGTFRIKANETVPHYSSVEFKPSESGVFEIRVERIVTTGQYTYTKVDELIWSSIVTRFESDPIITDKRHVFLELRIRATNQLNGTIDNLSGECSSAIDVWDGTQWTKQINNNPAWVFADLMTSEVSKKPIPKSRLHLPSLLEWANFCDEFPDSPPNRQYIFKRFETNFILDYGTTLQAALNQVASAAQASPTIIDGKYGVFVDRLQTTPVQIFTPRNSSKFSSLRNYSSRPHGVKVKYIDPYVGWRVSELVAYDDGYGPLPVTSNITAVKTLTVDGVVATGNLGFTINNVPFLVLLSPAFADGGASVEAAIQSVEGFEATTVTSPNSTTLVITFTGVVGPVNMQLVSTDLATIIPAIIEPTLVDTVVGQAVTAVATEIEEMTSFACTNDEQAWRFGRYMIAQNKLRQETMSIQVDFEQLVCTRGDYVQISQDVMRVGGTPARVKAVAGTIITIDDSPDLQGAGYGYTFRSATGSISTSTLTVVDVNQFDLDGEVPAVGDLIIVGQVGSIVFDCLVKSIAPNEDLSATIVLIEKSDAIYDYESTGHIPEYDAELSSVIPQEFQPPGPVTNLTVVASAPVVNESGTGLDYPVVITYDPPANSTSGDVYQVIIDPAPAYTDKGGFLSAPKTTLYYSKVALTSSQLGVPLTIKVVAMDSKTGLSLPPALATSVTLTVDAKTTPPSDVTAISTDIVGQSLQLSWPKLADTDISYYMVRYSPDVNATWSASTPLIKVEGTTTLVTVQARTGEYLIKAYDFAGNESVNAAAAVTTVPDLFDLNVVEYIRETDFPSESMYQAAKTALGYPVLALDSNGGYFSEGFYYYHDMLNLGEIFTVTLESRVKAAGLGDSLAMADWETLSEVDLLNEIGSTATLWDVEVQYRAISGAFEPIESWATLDSVPFLAGEGATFTPWRTFYRGQATGQVFQFRLRLLSYAANVTPVVLDGLIVADMPDRVEPFTNLSATADGGYEVIYDVPFKGPVPSPNIQISIDEGDSGDYWRFVYRDLTGFKIQFYDWNEVPVARTFDAVVRGWGHQYSIAV